MLQRTQGVLISLLKSESEVFQEFDPYQYVNKFEKKKGKILLIHDGNSCAAHSKGMMT